MKKTFLPLLAVLIWGCNNVPEINWGDRLVACGDSCIFIIDAKASTEDSLVIERSWTVSDAVGMIPEEFRTCISAIDECKPVAGGTKLLVTSSRGGCFLLDLRSGRVMFYANCPMAHSAELLPGGRIVIASSTHPKGNRLSLYEIGLENICLWEDSLYFGHGAVWSDKYQRLFALGDRELRSYRLKNWDALSPELECDTVYTLPGEQGHDLSPAGDDRLLVTGTEVWDFDIRKGTFTDFKALAGMSDIKSVNLEPRSGKIIYTRAKTQWWTNHISFKNPDKTLNFPEAFRLYKVRVLTSTNDVSELPDYYTDYLDRKAEEIKKAQKDEADGFYFWTDQHYPNNACNSVALLKCLQEKCGVRKIFCGGDIAGICDNLQYLMDWMDEDLCKLESVAPVYVIRGNHEFDIDSRTKGKGRQIRHKEEAATYVRKHIAADAVLDSADSLGCYFYLDNPEAGIRYLCMDTSCGEGGDGRPVTLISEAQSEWLRKAMTDNLPEGWHIVSLSHIPLSSNLTKVASLIAMADTLATLPEGRLLMHLAGHCHCDATTAIGEVFEVLTASDCLQLPAPGFISEWHTPEFTHNVGDWSEQRFDYISLSKDWSSVRFIHIGYGQNQTFHTKVKEMQNGRLRLKSSLEGPVKWHIHDAHSGKRTKVPGCDIWDCEHNFASIDDKGEVTAKSAGLSIAVAVGKTGDREFFLIKSR